MRTYGIGCPDWALAAPGRTSHSCARYVRTSDVCQVFQLHAAPGGLRHLAILADEIALPFLPPVLGMRT